MAEDIVTGYQAAVMDLPMGNNLDAMRAQLAAVQALRPQLDLAEMKIAIIGDQRSRAAALGGFAVDDQRRWDGGSLPEEQAVFYAMLTPDMKRILLTHGGTATDNRSARPQEWKDDGPGVELWVFKSGGAVVTTYVFTNGVLTNTLKP